MKKFIAIALAAVMSMAVLTGCGSSGSSDTEPATESASASGVQTVQEGVLTMGTNAYFPPYEYYEGSEIVGIDAEIAQEIADRLGLELSIQDMEFDSIITAVQTGKVDMGLAGMTVTEDRKKNVNFTDSYVTDSVQAIVVPEGSDIQGPEDLTGKTIGVQLSTTGDELASAEFGSDHVEKYNKGNDAILALKTNKVDAVIIDGATAQSYAASTEGLVVLDTAYSQEEYAACINKENTELLEKVNAALAEMKEDGTIDAIKEKYKDVTGEE